MRRRILAILLVTIALLDSACSRPTEGPAPERERTPAPITETTTIRVAYRRTNHTQLSAEFDAFRERYPHYHIESFSFLDEDPAEFIKEQRVDVILPVDPTYSLWDLFTSDLLLDVEPYIRNSTLDLGAFGDMLARSQHEGKQVAMPYALIVDGLMFDKQTLFRLGITQPEAPRTWTEFRTTLYELAGTVDGVRVPSFSSGWSNEAMVSWYLLSKAEGQWLPVSDEDLREALLFFQALIFEDQTMEPSQPRDFVNPNPNYTHTFPVVPPPLGIGGASDVMTYPVFPYPAYDQDSKPIMYASPAMAGIAANSPVPEAAWEFVQFLVGEDGAAMTARRGRVPAYHSEAVMQAWQERPGRTPETDRILGARFVEPLSEEQALLNRYIQNAANRVFSGAMTIDESIAQWRLDIASIGQ